MQKLAKAVIAVMKEVKGIDKSMTVGTGSYSYKGVSDKDVKNIIGDAMAKHGLCILPTSCKTNTTISSWEETYNGNTKRKQSVFTEVETGYTLLHESGESIELAGTGSGVDSGDKASGKATTYALKYTLLYAFLTPTGKIDDADTTHSNEQPQPQRTYKSKEETLKLINEAKSKAALSVIKADITHNGLTAEATKKAGEIASK